MGMPMLRALLLLLCLTSPVLAGEKLSGVASVIDGDTIEIHGTRIRLHGIDAPESSQTCKSKGIEYRCGKAAAFALADKIGRRPVTCEQRDTDRYGRVVAVCTLDGVDLNRWLVHQGHAIAYRQYSYDYVPDEDAAKAAHVGIWGGEFENPADFRKHRKKRRVTPAETETQRPASRTVEPRNGGKGLSDSEIAQILIRQSQAGYSGSCPCPDNVDRAGRRCGRRSAYSRPGGASPLGYESDVTPALIAAYRRQH